MRRVYSPEVVQFRASEGLVAALRAEAEKADCSVSEYLRATVREKVGLH